MFYKELETDRMILENISKNDRTFIFEHFSDEVVTRYLYDEEPLKTIDGADEIIEFYLKDESCSQHRWILTRKSDGMKMGTCGFHCWDEANSKIEIGYDLNEAFWGKGYMEEAVRAIIDFVTQKKWLKQVDACIYFENKRSISLVEKLGFKLTDTKYDVFRGEKYLHHVYSLII
ncbi:MAG: GNAT family N-acetyltransferase [Clostridiales bacterium]|nr:GNAT family N-acetyltransferase [Clostridiales bacterium]